MADRVEANRQASARLVAEFPSLFEEAFEVWCMAGWYEIVRQCCLDIVESDDLCRAAQLKEKFGGVRFYVDDALPSTLARIQELESLSLKTCSVCGAPGRVQSRGGWLTALCQECV